MRKNDKKLNNLPSKEAVDAERERLQYRSRFRRTLQSTIYILIVVAAIAVLLSCVFVPVMQISGNSMEPELNNNDIIVLLKTNNLDTGDLICFSWNNRTLLKRVIAKAGDWVNIDRFGTVYVNGEPLYEPYVSDPDLGECDTEFPVQVPENSFWVMGDKRETSIDSRSSLVGCVSKEQIIGKVELKVWPKLSLIGR